MISYKKDTNNIVTLTLDMANREVNVINHEISRAFLPVMEHLQQEKEAGQLKGVIITSAKKTFLAGGDLEYLQNSKDPEQIFEFSQKIQAFFRTIERPGVPVVAAINGTALGTGFELALACHHRIAIDEPKTRIGLPEVKLGMMPGGGAVIRLLWLLGLERAFPVLTRGRRYSPREAHIVGIIDELAQNEEDMMEKARTWLLQNAEMCRLWDRKGGKIPGGTAHDLSLATTIQGMTARLIKNTYLNFPAPRAILNTLVEGSKVDFDTACRIESRYFTELLLSRESRNMVKAFWFDRNAIQTGENRPKGFGKFRPRKVGIIGAGRMGSGIALACLREGLEVVIKDISKVVAQRGREYAEQELDGLVRRGKISESEKDKRLSAITATDTSEDFEDCDLVIEAVFENKTVKTKVTREAEKHMDDYSIFASNTSSIPISDLGS
ncbi:MAG: 3-hydroxyacyl-CoA dehydrogenase NAD-binding domain-containing protein, partial [Bacteroidota bacterium]